MRTLFVEKKYVLVLFLGLALTIMSGCGKRAGLIVIPSTVLLLDTTLSELNDSVFIPPLVNCIDVSNGFLYYSDYNEGLMVLNKDYQLEKQVGRHGQAPGELLGASHFYIVDSDSIYILNDAKQSIEFFVDDMHVQTIPLPLKSTSGTRFLVNDCNIYHSVFAKEAPVVVFGNRTPSFLCSYSKADNVTMERHATNHVLAGKDCFFLIGCVYPTLQQYSMEGKLLREFDLSVVPEIANMMKTYRTEPQVAGTYLIAIQDVYFHNDRLYLLTVTPCGNTYCCNTVIVLDMSGLEWSYVANYHLAGKAYRTFCVSDDRIYAHDVSKSCLDIFYLDYDKSIVR